MTQEDIKLVLVDLCGRLPYGVKVKLENDNRLYQLLMLHPRNDAAMIGLLFEGKDIEESYVAVRVHISNLKPYLRPMSSMTEVEVKELYMLLFRVERLGIPDISKGQNAISLLYDWLNKKMFDYRGLIEKGLALEAPEDMYKEEQQ